MPFAKSPGGIAIFAQDRGDRGGVLPLESAVTRPRI